MFILFCFCFYREENDNEDEVEFTTKLGNSIVLQEDSAFSYCLVISDPNKTSRFFLVIDNKKIYLHCIDI